MVFRTLAGVAAACSLLGRVLLHMELGHTLILRDCGIFRALYDMLNQNHTIVGGRRNCCIALGPHSNPMCAVHEDFRAVVVMTPAQAAAADPSLLNRFEKQWLDASQLLPVSHQQLLLQPLQRWVQLLGAASSGSSSSSVGWSAGSSSSSSSAPPAAGFGAAELFLGLHADSLPSLLLHLTSKASSSSSSSSGSSSRCYADSRVAHLLSSSVTQQALLAASQRALIACASLDEWPGLAAMQQDMRTQLLLQPTATLEGRFLTWVLL
jgi:hypothetical protein